VSSLLPEGCESLLDAPYHVVDAILFAIRFLRFEELPLEDQPPKRIWLDVDKLKAHWDQVDHNRKARAEGRTPSGPTDTNAAADDMLIG
jgi:hypothetical protein